MSETDELPVDDGEQVSEPATASTGREPATAASHAIVTVDDAMTLAQASAMSRRRGARLVLLAGEAGSGRTAMCARLWQRQLELGEIGGHRLAGTRTASGFERRRRWAAAAAAAPETHLPQERSVADGLLHLRLRRADGWLVELLLSDVAGARFERVREGRPLLEELPWASRVDRFAVVIDGAAMSRPGESEIAITRSRRLLLALAAGGVVRETARVAIVITNGEAIGHLGERALARHGDPLLALAQACDPEAVLLSGSIRSEADGLEELTAWMCADDRARAPLEIASVQPERAIAAFRA